ncbi:MAG: mannose-1-phosphate guanyltransferase [Dehalococcoidia bacterium]|nr:mannose-1-phosphate guanyltransferase [Dehalococcoidia bacterium]
MKAVVMAGGEGSRLRPLTIARPKPMVPIVNKPCMEHILTLLKRHGITEVVVTLQYRASDIQDYFGDGSSLSMKISYSVEETPLGTAGSVKNAESQLRDDTFLVISGDALTDFDLGAIIKAHREKKALATITLYSVPNPLEYGVIVTAPDGRIRQFLEKPSWGEVISDTVNTGVYVLQPEIFDFYKGGEPVDFSQDVFPLLLQRNEALFGFVVEGYWCDVGSLQEYMRANQDVLNGKVDVGSLGKHLGGGIWVESEDVDIHPGAQMFGPVFIGSDCKVRAGAVIHGPSVIRSSSIIDSSAQVSRSIVWRDSYIGERAELRGAIVGQQCSIKSRAIVFEGAVIGDRTVVEEGAIIQPGVKIWPNKVVERGATVNSSIIWGSQGARVLFGRYGVTGLVNVDMTPEFAAKVGAAYGATLAKGATVIMNRDPHRAPRMIKRAMISGLPSAGVNVLDIKSVPVPVARYLTRISSAIGGVHVRLSPFDARTVDIKLFDGRGLDLDKSAQRKIENTFFREDFRRAHMEELGVISEGPELSQRYVEGFNKSLDLEVLGKTACNSSIVIDYANGSCSAILPGLLNHFGCNTVTLNASMDEGKLARSPQEFDQGMGQLAAIVSVLHGDFGVRLDVGGERVYVVDDLGNVVDPMTLLAALASLVLSLRHGGTIAVPVSAPSIFEQIALRHGGTVVRTKVDPSALMLAASRDGVVLAGDGEGGIVFPAFHPGFDGLFMVAKIVELLATAGVQLSEVVRSLPQYHMTHGRVACPWEAKGKVMRILNEQYRDRKTRQVDGVKIDMGQEWVLVLPDADRPLFHVIAESTTADGANALMDKYSSLVSGLQQKG